MDRLRGHFEELGFSDVQTFIASGNVVFSSDDTDMSRLESRISEHLERCLGFEVATFLRSLEELVQVAAFEAPAGVAEGDSVYVIFLARPAPEEARRRLTELASDDDRFEPVGREIYWILKGKLSESPLFKAGLGRALGDLPNSMRNITSVRKLLAKHGPRA